MVHGYEDDVQEQRTATIKNNGRQMRILVWVNFLQCFVILNFILIIFNFMKYLLDFFTLRQQLTFLIIIRLTIKKSQKDCYQSLIIQFVLKPIVL